MGEKWQKEESGREAEPSLERRRALDFLFAAICLVLLREINSPRHTDQYSLNPHLIWREFPPISPSLRLLLLLLLARSLSTFIFPLLSFSAIFHAPGPSMCHRRE